MAFNYFLISSQVHQEKNALSEAAWILSSLSSYTNIESFKAKLLPVGGLGLLQLENAIDLPEDIPKTISTLAEEEKIYYCFKIIPLEKFDIVSEEFLLDWVNYNLERFDGYSTWKVEINKRHSTLNRKSLINTIAKRISNPVDLKSPEIILQIEIIGKYVGIGLLHPYQIIQLGSLLSELNDQIIDEEEEVENGL